MKTVDENARQEGRSIECFAVERFERGVRERKGGTHGRERPLPIAASCSPAQLACLKTFFLIFKYIFDIHTHTHTHTHELHLISVYLVNDKKKKGKGKQRRKKKKKGREQAEGVFNILRVTCVENVSPRSRTRVALKLDERTANTSQRNISIEFTRENYTPVIHIKKREKKTKEGNKYVRHCVRLREFSFRFRFACERVAHKIARNILQVF